MGQDSKIEWTTNTFNPWIGCQKVAAGCTHCYAESFAKRYGKAEWGPEGTRVLTSVSYWKQPLKWNREAECNCGAAGLGPATCKFCAGGSQRPRVFCASMADVFEEWDGRMLNAKGETLYSCVSCQRRFAGPDQDMAEPSTLFCECGHACSDPCMWLNMAEVRRDLFALIDATPNLDWLLLTKRPENVRRMWPSEVYQQPTKKTDSIWRHNVWIGTSIAEQRDADTNIPELLKCRELAPVLFLSCEPLVGQVDLSRIMVEDKSLSPGDREYPSYSVWDALTGFHGHKAGGWNSPQKADWAIVGGESGHGARPCDVNWIRAIRDQCAAADVPCFIKQLGSRPTDLFDGNSGQETGAIHLNDRKGGDWSEWPEDLRVREFPSVEQPA